MTNISPKSGANTEGISCLASYETGQRFSVEAKKLGCRVYLLAANRALPQNSNIFLELAAINDSVWKLFELGDGVSHSKFTRSSARGESLFLDTSARARGACITQAIEPETGVDLWAEWAKIKRSLGGQEWPDTSVFSDPEVVRKLAKRPHVGLVVGSPDGSCVAEQTDLYTRIVRKDSMKPHALERMSAFSSFQNNDATVVGC